MKNFCLFAVNPTSQVQMLRLAKELSRYGVDSLLLCDRGFSGLDEETQRAYITLEKLIVKPNKIFQRLIALIDSVILEGFAIALHILKLRRILRRMLSAESLNAAIVYGDRHTPAEILFVRECRRLHVPVLVIELASISSSERIVHKFDEHQTGTFHNLYQNHLIPKDDPLVKKCPNAFRQGSKSREVMYSFYPVFVARALSYLGLLPQNPWVIGANESNALLVSSFAQREKSIGDGVDETKIHVVGCFSDDILFRHNGNLHLQTKIRQKYGVGDGPLIIFSVPQVREHNHELKITDEMAGFSGDFCRLVSQSSHLNVLLSLHPKMQRKDYLDLEGPRVRLADEPIEKLVSVGDLLVCISGSSVARLGRLARKTVITFTLSSENVGSGSLDFCRLDFLRHVENWARDDSSFLRILSKPPDHDFDRRFFDGNVVERIIEYAENFELRDKS